MSIYSRVQSGTKVFRSRFPNKFQRYAADITFRQCYPVFKSFVLPGDVHRLSYDMLVRMQPMRAPYLNRNTATVRYFFVPLRLVEENAEFVITGSRDGHYDSSVEVPEFKNVWQVLFERYKSESFEVGKGSFFDLFFGIPAGTYVTNPSLTSSVLDDVSAPAWYWIKGWFRVWWDYYRDENLTTSVTDFDEWFDSTAWNILLLQENGVHAFFEYSALAKKDYFTSSLPWQLKGIAPTVPISINADYTGAFNILNSSSNTSSALGSLKVAFENTDGVITYPPTGTLFVGSPGVKNTTRLDNARVTQAFNSFINSGLSLGTAGFNADELRLMMAQTRIFERLARTGSRYTEYLRANFNTSPADGTLQRAQYLGGGKQDIVLTEVVQTAGATNDQGNETPVGTLRGHGISRGGNRLSTCRFSEFGMLYGVLDVRPERIYTQGVRREFTYRSRWDFFNPSFQHLSEQEVRNGEVYYSNDGLNDETFGFQGMYNELRSSSTSFVGELRGNLSYWSQAYIPASRPNLNNNFLRGQTSDFLRPFDVTDVNLARPMILDFCTYDDCYRPMVREAVPGLIDHN